MVIEGRVAEGRDMEDKEYFGQHKERLLLDIKGGTVVAVWGC